MRTVLFLALVGCGGRQVSVHAEVVPAAPQECLDPGSCLLEARSYLGGEHGNLARDRGVTLLERACSDGAARACIELADEHVLSRLLPADGALQRRFMQRACELGDGLGCLRVSYLLDQIGSAERDAYVARAMPLLDAACEQGNSESCRALGALALERADYGASQSLFARARAIDEPRCARDEREACRGLAVLTVPGDRFTRRACELGDGEACHIGGAALALAPASLHLEGGERLERLALEIDRAECERGVAETCETLAFRLEPAEQPAVRARAAALHREACEAGRVVACTNLAALMFHYLGEPAQGLALYERACRGGDVRACSDGGSLGIDTSQRATLERASAMWREGCDHGHEARLCEQTERLERWLAHGSQPAEPLAAIASAVAFGLRDGHYELAARHLELPFTIVIEDAECSSSERDLCLAEYRVDDVANLQTFFEQAFGHAPMDVGDGFDCERARCNVFHADVDATLWPTSLVELVAVELDDTQRVESIRVRRSFGSD